MHDFYDQVDGQFGVVESGLKLVLDYTELKPHQSFSFSSTFFIFFVYFLSFLLLIFYLCLVFCFTETGFGLSGGEYKLDMKGVFCVGRFYTWSVLGYLIWPYSFDPFSLVFLSFRSCCVSFRVHSIRSGILIVLSAIRQEGSMFNIAFFIHLIFCL